jgi:hypothetical protein
VSGVRFDWRWVVGIVVLVALTNSTRLPWPITVLLVGGGGAWLLAQGWRVWVREGGPPERSRVTYWRGQRVELSPPGRGPALPRWRDIGPAAIYLLLGAVMVLAAAAIALRNLGI